MLDPGHGGAHNGAEYGGIKEKDLNLAIAARTAGLLEAEGVTVRMTRTGDQDVDLYARSGLANTLAFHESLDKGPHTYSTDVSYLSILSPDLTIPGASSNLQQFQLFLLCACTFTVMQISRHNG